MIKKIVIWCALLAQVMGFSLFETTHDEDLRYLEVVNAIKSAVITTQKTRGLTNNFMNGNISAQLLVYGQRMEMKKDFAGIQSALKDLEDKHIFSESASALMARSQRLNKKAFKSDSAQTFADYSKVIEGWIDLNRVIIDHHFTKRSNARYSMVSTLNNVLLPLTENIGKMRGLGSGIVARTFCKDEESPKMQRFVNEIDRYRGVMALYLQKEKFDALSQVEVAQINENIQAYTQLTLQNVIDQSNIDLDTNGYFDQGTAAISDVLKVYNVMIGNLKKP